MGEKSNISPDGIPEGQGEINKQNLKPEIAPEKLAPEVTPEKPAEEKSAEEKPPIDFEQFLNAKDVLTKEELPKKIEVKPSEEKETPVEVKTEKPTRDLSDLDPEIASVFRQMSNEAFQKLKPIYSEYKKAADAIKAKEAEIQELKKGRLPESYYEHPQAFVLTPEFVNISKEVKICEDVANHWANQLSKVRSGAAEIELVDIDQNGKLIPAGKMPADDRAEAEVLRYMNFSQNQLFQRQQKLQGLAESHQSRSSQVRDWVKKQESTAFPAFDAKENENYRKIVDETVNNFPPAIKASPVATYLAKSLITNSMLFKAYTELKNAKPPVSQQAKAGPTAQDAATDTKVNKEPDITFDAFKKVMEGVPV